MRRRAVFLRNHSISWEMAVPDAILLQNALVARSPVPPSWSGTASRRTFIRNRLFLLCFAMIRPTTRSVLHILTDALQILADDLQILSDVLHVLADVL